MFFFKKNLLVKQSSVRPAFELLQVQTGMSVEVHVADSEESFGNAMNITELAFDIIWTAPCNGSTSKTV